MDYHKSKCYNLLGFITAYPDELGAPLDGMQWLMPCVFVKPELRRRGIGSALLREMIKSAKAEQTAQLGLGPIMPDGETLALLRRNNFGLCIWHMVSGEKTGVHGAADIIHIRMKPTEGGFLSIFENFLLYWSYCVKIINAYAI